MQTTTLAAAAAAMALAPLAPNALGAVRTDNGSFSVTSTAESGVPTYDVRTLSDQFDGQNDTGTVVFTSLRDATAAINGGGTIDATGATTAIDLYAAGDFNTASVGSTDYTLDATWTVVEATRATIGFDSTWIVDGPAGAPGQVTLDWSFAGLSGSFDSQGSSDTTGIIDEVATVELAPGPYRLLINAATIAPNEGSRLYLEFGLGFISIPSPGSVAVAGLAAIVVGVRRRR